MTQPAAEIGDVSVGLELGVAIMALHVIGGITAFLWFGQNPLTILFMGPMLLMVSLGSLSYPIFLIPPLLSVLCIFFAARIFKAGWQRIMGFMAAIFVWPSGVVVLAMTFSPL